LCKYGSKLLIDDEALGLVEQFHQAVLALIDLGDTSENREATAGKHLRDEHELPTAAVVRSSPATPARRRGQLWICGCSKAESTHRRPRLR
jgi:hypothetical protein